VADSACTAQRGLETPLRLDIAVPVGLIFAHWTRTIMVTGRQKAIGRARARLEKRSYGNESWQVILQYAFGEPNLQMADRATALVLGSILEQGLELAILSHCVLGWNTPEAEAEQRKLFGGGGDGPMNLAVKIRLAFALGVYGPKTRDDLDTMRHIRNFFAHDKGHLTFDDSIVAALCDQLEWIDRVPWGGIIGQKPSTPRGRYVETVKYIFPFLTVGVGQPIKYLTSPFPEMFV
jgi:Mannitol repressor